MRDQTFLPHGMEFHRILFGLKPCYPFYLLSYSLSRMSTRLLGALIGPWEDLGALTSFFVMRYTILKSLLFVATVAIKTSFILSRGMLPCTSQNLRDTGAQAITFAPTCPWNKSLQFRQWCFFEMWSRILVRLEKRTLLMGAQCSSQSFGHYHESQVMQVDRLKLRVRDSAPLRVATDAISKQRQPTIAAQTEYSCIPIIRTSSVLWPCKLSGFYCIDSW